jgi:hypothetical protein
MRTTMTRRELQTKLAMGAALAVVFALTLSASAQPRPRRDWDYRSAPRVTERTLTLGAAPRIVVDNITGPITVTGDGGAQVRFTATEIIRARSQSALARGEREVKLDVTPGADGLRLYVDGPFRCGEACMHWDNPGYEPKFTFVLHVPRGSSVDLRTVNGGEVRATGVSGRFRVRNVNGGIDLADMGGAGEATTVNGPVEARFTRNPASDCRFRTVNGKISLYLQPGLNANLRLNTLNGDVYSDYPAAPVATRARADRDGRMIVFRRGRMTAARIGAGGPTLDLHTLNGSIFLHEVQ